MLIELLLIIKKYNNKILRVLCIWTKKHYIQTVLYVYSQAIYSLCAFTFNRYSVTDKHKNANIK